MDKQELYKSIGQVDDALLERTEEKRNYRPIRILAASLVLIIGIAGLSWLFWPEQSANSFRVTAYAENGEQTPLPVGTAVAIPEKKGTSPFSWTKFENVFEIAINPELWDTLGLPDTDFYLKASLSDQVGEGFVMEGRKIPAQEDGTLTGTPTQIVTGWLEESANVTILVVEKASNRLVAQITVHARYLPEQEAYELTVTESKTYFDGYVYVGQAFQRPEYPLTEQQLNAPTAALVDYIMEYPYLMELMFSSTFDSQHTYDSLRVAYHYNGFLELETRPDAASALLEEYADVVLNPTEENALDDNLLWTLLSVSPYKQMLTQEEAARFEELRDIKRQQDEAQLEQEAANGN